MTVILMDKSPNDSFDDAKGRAEELCQEKKMPVKFCWGGFWYTVEMGTSKDY